MIRFGVNKLKFEKTELEKVLLITPPTNFEDFRGEYIEIYNKKLMNESGIDIEFIQDDISSGESTISVSKTFFFK